MSRSIGLTVAAGVFTAAILVVAFIAFPGGDGGDGAASSSKTSGDAIPRSELDAIQRRNDELQRRVEELEREREVRPGRSRSRTVPGTGPGVIRTAVAGDAASNEALRDLVTRVVEESLERRRAAAQRRPETGPSGVLALGRGPFGEYNYKVNSLSKVLGFEENQRYFYHEVLVEFAPRFEELRARVDGQNPESRETYREQQDLLQAQLDTRFAEGLTPAQRETYRGLPEWVRRPDPHAVEGSPAPPPGDG